jgi:hypothetical protein
MHERNHHTNDGRRRRGACPNPAALAPGHLPPRVPRKDSASLGLQPRDGGRPGPAGYAGHCTNNKRVRCEEVPLAAVSVNPDSKAVRHVRRSLPGASITRSSRPHHRPPTCPPAPAKSSSRHGRHHPQQPAPRHQPRDRPHTPFCTSPRCSSHHDARKTPLLYAHRRSTRRWHTRRRPLGAQLITGARQACTPATCCCGASCCRAARWTRRPRARAARRLRSRSRGGRRARGRAPTTLWTRGTAAAGSGSRTALRPTAGSARSPACPGGTCSRTITD